MSFIITSNIDVNNYGKSPNVITQGINRPYSYSNSMDNIQIPEDSEIAVQSIKVNREGGISLSQQNNVFALYYGKPATAPPSDGNAQFMYDNIEQPIIGTIRNSLGEPSAEFNPNDLAEAIQESFNLFDFHPNNQKSDLLTDGWVVNASRLADTGFRGFTFKHSQFSSGSNVNKAKDLGDAIVPNSQFYNRVGLNALVNGTRLTVRNNLSQDSVESINPTVFTNIPMSLSGAKFNVSLTGYKNGSNTQNALKEYFEVGLTRCQRNQFIKGDSNTNANLQRPPYFQSAEGNGVGYYDWVVKNEDKGSHYELEIYHAVNTANGFRLLQVDYQSGLTGDGKFRVNNASYGVKGKGITNLEFRANGEIMDIAFINGSGEEVVISCNSYSGTNDKAYSSTKLHHLIKPIAQTTWMLYPKMWVPGHGPGAGSARNTLEIITYNGVIPTGVRGSYVYGGVFYSSSRPAYLPQEDNNIYDNQTDFYSSCMNDTYPLEMSAVIDMGTKGLDFSNLEDTNLPVYNGSKTVGGADFIDLNNAIVMGHSDIYRVPPEVSLNTKQILGFPNFAVIKDTDPGQTVGKSGVLLLTTFQSEEPPKMISGKSTFVRVRNLTHTTSNVANRSNSKILYHIPKFDNSGVETGNLFFEPPERVYVKLNNSTKLNLNTFDVDLVDAREMLQESYSGTTVVCFHIRKAK